MHTTQVKLTEQALAAHMVSAHNRRIHVGIDADFKDIFGHCSTKTTVAGELSYVVLLADDSPREHPKIRDGAEQEFRRAAEELLRYGKAFCTILHMGWGLPAVVWTRQYL